MSDWRTIPGLPGYVINCNDGVLVNPKGFKVPRSGKAFDCYIIKRSDGKRAQATIEVLIKLAQKGHIVTSPIQKKRHCHDCGKVTTNYRCDDCWKKWRKKHGVSLNGDNTDIVYYGSTYRGGGGHAHQE